MDMFSACSGECCVCAASGHCLAGHGDDDYYPATKEQIIERLNNDKYKHYHQYMINFLQTQFGINYKDIKGDKIVTAPEISEEKFIEYHKRFANGEQYIEMNALGEITPMDNKYYWQEKGVYNHITMIVDICSKKNLTEEQIYGKNGLVSRLIPLQRAYNAVMNREIEYLNRLSIDTVCVEEGSVDIDELNEDGLSPDKVIVYRQGATPPTFLQREMNVKPFHDCADRLLSEMNVIMNNFIAYNRYE